ncbi:22718_t:CDS:2 [Gigaspora margarita]|uniref:22718_t:CDS:1 n=1 Tax=Gigaspora margarita TaxID=4874 RepID=A0ABM8W7A9_GIGMA|nr:22718_t:CDS:2 [Gigaspora margarita]
MPVAEYPKKTKWQRVNKTGEKIFRISIKFLFSISMEDWDFDYINGILWQKSPNCNLYINSKSLRGKNYYGFKDKVVNEGSWALGSILMPLKFADRILKDIGLICPEKQSDASKTRRNKNKENDSDISQLYCIFEYKLQYIYY